jgi:hypothetical protein
VNVRWGAAGVAGRPVGPFGVVASRIVKLRAWYLLEPLPYTTPVPVGTPKTRRSLLLKTTAASLLIALTVSAGLTFAHGPSRKKVSLDQAIAATPEAVWAVVGNFQDMSWHPAVVKTEGQGGNVPGATRTLTLTGGGQIFEQLEKYDAEKHSLYYRIDKVDPKVLPVTNYASWISVASGPDGNSVVTWKGAFYRGYPNNDPPPDMNDQAAVDAVTGVYKAGLDNLKALVEKAK